MPLSNNVIPIGLGYRARHGKGTVARAIHCTWPKETWIFSLTDSLKTYYQTMDWMREKDSRLLQLIDSEIFRDHVNPNQ